MGCRSALRCGWGLSRNLPAEVVAVLAFHHWRACRPLVSYVALGAQAGARIRKHASMVPSMCLRSWVQVKTHCMRRSSAKVVVSSCTHRTEVAPANARRRATVMRVHRLGARGQPLAHSPLAGHSSAGVGTGRPVSYIAMEAEDDFELRLRDTGRLQLLLQNTAVNCIKSFCWCQWRGWPLLGKRWVCSPWPCAP